LAQGVGGYKYPKNSKFLLFFSFFFFFFKARDTYTPLYGVGFFSGRGVFMKNNIFFAILFLPAALTILGERLSKTSEGRYIRGGRY
jgi:hypothetical protein